MFGADAWNEIFVSGYLATMISLILGWRFVLPIFGLLWVIGGLS